MACPICGQKAPNCDCTATERAQHELLEDALAEITRLREERRWIPVGERLPEEGQEVLCVSSIGNIYAQSVVVFYKDDLGVAVWEDDDGFTYRPTHWMPLPAPPKGGEVGK